MQNSRHLMITQGLKQCENLLGVKKFASVTLSVEAEGHNLKMKKSLHQVTEPIHPNIAKMLTI